MMKSRIPNILIITILILVLTTFSFPIRKDTKLLLGEIDKLTTLLNSLDKKVNILSSEFTSLYKKVKIIDEKITAVTKNQADEGQTKESISLSLQFLKEEINSLKNSIGKVYDRLVQIPTSNSAAGSQSGNTTGTQENNVSVENPDNIYYTAYSDYIKKNYQLAINGFKQFLKYYPENALADNSLYWIGECYYAQKDFKKAVDAFSEIISKYKDGDKVPDALLKMGYALIETGSNEEGLNVLKKLVKQFPLSEEASLAQQKIRDINE